MSILIETAYLPPVAYMKEVLLADVIVIEAYETYTKQTCRNHCTIYGPNGSQTLSIPVIKVNGNHTITGDIRISEHQPWQRIHWRSIETAYNNSPFFLFYQDHLAPFYEKRFGFLIDFDLQLTEVLLSMMHISCGFQKNDAYEKTPAGVTDCRNSLTEKSAFEKRSYPHYTQVFEPCHGFIPGLSIIDTLFNLGPETRSYLDSLG